MTWADVTGDTIRVVQQKTGAKLTISLHSDLRAILAETKLAHVPADAERRVVLVTEDAADQHRVIDDLAGKPRGADLDVVHRHAKPTEVNSSLSAWAHAKRRRPSSVLARMSCNMLAASATRSAPGGVTFGRPLLARARNSARGRARYWRDARLR
jgi:NADPH-dependent ferric siderophore reductase